MEIIKRSIIFTIIPAIFILGWIIQHKFSTGNQVVTAFLMILVYYVIGLVLLKCISMSKGKNNRINSIRLVTLVLIDQFVKFCLKLFLHNT